METSVMSCTDCQFHTMLDGVIHLCTIPVYCANALPPSDDDDSPRFDEDDGREILGASCDVMRQMEAACGPRGRLWGAKG